MNRRQTKKNRKRLLLLILEKMVGSLDEKNGRYKARVLPVLSVELKTITKMNGYRIEIRTTREDNHNYAHFHVVKGTDAHKGRLDTWLLNQIL